MDKKELKEKVISRLWISPQDILIDSLGSFKRVSKFFNDLGIITPLRDFSEDTMEQFYKNPIHRMLVNLVLDDDDHRLHCKIITEKEIPKNAVSLEDLMSFYYGNLGIVETCDHPNLIKILENTPTGEHLWSQIFGDITLEKVDKDPGKIYIKTGDGTEMVLNKYGQFECCAIFPSKENHNWKNYKPSRKIDLIRYMRYTVPGEEFWCDAFAKNLKFLETEDCDPYYAKMIDGYQVKDNGEVFWKNGESVGLLFPKDNNETWKEYFDRKMIDRHVMVRTSPGATWKLKIYKGQGKYIGLDGMNQLDGNKGTIIIPFDDFDPKNINNCLKYSLT